MLYLRLFAHTGSAKDWILESHACLSRLSRLSHIIIIGTRGVVVGDGVSPRPGLVGHGRSQQSSEFEMIMIWDALCPFF